MLRIASHATEYAAQCGVDTVGDLVVSWSGRDALDEGALFIAIRELEVIEKRAIPRECAGTRYGGLGILPGPGVWASDRDRSSVGASRRSARAEQFETSIEDVVRSELRRRE